MMKFVLGFIIALSFAPQVEASKKQNTKKPAAASSSKKKTKAKKAKAKSKSKFKKATIDGLKKKAEELQSGSLLILQDGKFVVEKNWQPPVEFYYLHGLTSSIVTMALGSIFDEGKIQLESTMSQWIPDWKENAGQIKVSQLLNHTSGFADDPNDLWYKSSDTWTWLKNATPKEEPGANFNATDINPLLLGYILQTETNTDAEDLLKKRIFKPLKIQKWFWQKDKAGHLNTASGLQLRTYDVLKIGSLMLDQGEWEDQKIISSEWLTQVLAPSEKNPQYGYGWWIREENGVKAYYSMGYQGQYLVVIPDRRVVAVRLRPLIPMDHNREELDWPDFPKEVLQAVAN